MLLSHTPAQQKWRVFVTTVPPGHDYFTVPDKLPIV
jgi:hypothetical protein